MQKRCRMCGCFYAVLVSALKDIKLLEQLSKLYNVTILQEDKLPRVICSPCNDIVNNNWEFYVHVQNVQDILEKELSAEERNVKKASRCNGKKEKKGKSHKIPVSSPVAHNKELPILINERDIVPVVELENNELPILTNEQDVPNLQLLTNVQSAEFVDVPVVLIEVLNQDLPILTSERDNIEVPFTETQNEELPLLNNEQEVVDMQISFTEEQNIELPILTNERDVDTLKGPLAEVENSEFPLIIDEQEDETESIFIEVTPGNLANTTNPTKSVYNSEPKLKVQKTLTDGSKNKCMNRIPALNDNVQSNTSNKPRKGQLEYQWKCAQCLVLNTFPTTDKLHEHYEQAHQQVPRYACTDCAFICDNLIMFIEHVKIHRPSFKFCCNVCGQWFMTFGDLVEHRVQHRNGWVNYTPSCHSDRRSREKLNGGAVSLRKYKFKCPKCFKEFKTARGPAAHKKFGCPTTITSVNTSKCFM